MTTKLNFGIPDLDLACASGATINPASFAGHSLIVVFLPDEPQSAAREVDLLQKTAADIAKYDGWIIAFGGNGQPTMGHSKSPILIVADPGQRAWASFRQLADYPEAMDPAHGATFLFSRGGNLWHCWPGTGHLENVLQLLRTPACEHSGCIA